MTTTMMQAREVRPVDNRGPVWADEVTPWARAGDGVWSRQFTGMNHGATVRQTVTRKLGESAQHSDLEVIKASPDCPAWCTSHGIENRDDDCVEFEQVYHQRVVLAGSHEVLIVQAQDAQTGRMLGVDILPSNWAELTPVEAAELGAALIQAAELVRG